MAQKYLTTEEIQKRLNKIYELEKSFIGFRDEVNKHFEEEHAQLEKEIAQLRAVLVRFKASTEKELLRNQGKQARAIEELKSE